MTLPNFEERLTIAVQNESKKFRECYCWLEEAMPPIFFEDVDYDNVMLITHSLMGFPLQQYFSTIHLKNLSIAICLDSPDADLRILKNYSFYGIKDYQTYLSKTPPPFAGINSNLRIAILRFTEVIDLLNPSYPNLAKELLRTLVKERNPLVRQEEFDLLLSEISPRFLRLLPLDRLLLSLEMFFRAQTRDNCQYEVRYNEEWQKEQTASMQIVLAWRNAPKHNFLYRLARIIYRHGLVMLGVNACYINQYSHNGILMMVLSLHGMAGKAVWEEANIPDFIRELVTVKYFASFDSIDLHLVSKGVVSGTMGNFLRSLANFVHQALVHIDVNLYSLENILEGICRHPELTALICQAFQDKFDPNQHDEQAYLETRQHCLQNIDKIDTGNEENDLRRKNILLQGMNFIHHTLKTNFFLTNYTALSFRLDPHYLDFIPFDRTVKFPELPYAIIFIKGMHFFGFHIRFRDLARGGLRTVFPEQLERITTERNNVFAECYNLAYTQQLKNKDIPEGGAKAIIFLKPLERLESEAAIYRKELQASKENPEEIEKKIELYLQEQKLESLYQAQRSFIDSLLTIVNCELDGTLRAKNVIDYWKRPEYLYLGPDENMHDSMIQWIADTSKKRNYKPGSSFISSKPRFGINHKEYGVTSLGINVYMETVLKYAGINPSQDIFTVKMSGGPDGDVAGNQLLNLHKYYPLTAKVVAITDISGTIYDPEGLDQSVLVDLFHKVQPICYYPPEKLHEGAFLADRKTKRKQNAFAHQNPCWRMKEGVLHQDWLSSNDMNALWRSNLHKVKADVFITGGGRPRTLNQTNFSDFLDENGKPTSHIIIEGANLYLDSYARKELEDRSVLIIKDSSANKTGVICSSFEVLCGLTLGDELFAANKNLLVKEILERLKLCAWNEAQLLLRIHDETNEHMTITSARISKRINQFTDQIMEYLEPIKLSEDPQDPLIKCFLSYCLPTLRQHYRNSLLSEIPSNHKKAIIACHIAAQLVYQNGLAWFPSIVDILPVVLEQLEHRLNSINT